MTRPRFFSSHQHQSKGVTAAFGKGPTRSFSHWSVWRKGAALAAGAGAVVILGGFGIRALNNGVWYLVSAIR